MSGTVAVTKKCDGQTFYKCPACRVFKVLASFQETKAQAGTRPCRVCTSTALRLAQMDDGARQAWVRANNSTLPPRVGGLQ